MTGSRREPRPLSRGDRVAIAVTVIAIGAAAVFLWLGREPATAPANAPPPAPAASEAAASGTAPAPEVDPARVRSLLEGVSPDASFRKWIAAEDPVRRWAVVTDNLAEGVTPRKQLPFLSPGQPFSVIARGGRKVISPDSYRRYDRFADTVASIDAKALALVYRELHPALEAAYRALGYPGASLDRVTAKALQRLAAAPVEDGDVVVRNEGGIYLYADPRLERLGAVEKHLLRMGPRNERLVQAKAREIQQALGLTVEVTAEKR